jgi:cytochrome P450
MHPELLPIKATRLAALSFREWGKYMNDLYEKKSIEVANTDDHELAGMDLMAAMIKSSSQSQKSSKSADVGLSKDEIIGNSFVLFLAGHETAANTIHFAMLFLAMNPAFQRTLQGKQ